MMVKSQRSSQHAEGAQFVTLKTIAEHAIETGLTLNEAVEQVAVVDRTEFEQVYKEMSEAIRTEQLRDQSPSSVHEKKYVPGQGLFYTSIVVYAFGLLLFVILGYFTHKDAPVAGFAIPVFLVGGALSVWHVMDSSLHYRSLDNRGKRHLFISAVIASPVLVYFAWAFIMLFRIWVHS